MRQLRLMFTTVVLVAALASVAVLALADERPSATKTAASAASQIARDATAPNVTPPAVDEKRLQAREDQFLAERDRYREIQRSGAPAVEVDAQRKKMEQARDEMRALRQQTCPVGFGVGRGAGNGRGFGAGRRGMGGGPGLGQGRGPGAGPGGMGRGNGWRGGMSQPGGTPSAADRGEPAH